MKKKRIKRREVKRERILVNLIALKDLINIKLKNLFFFFLKTVL